MTSRSEPSIQSPSPGLFDYGPVALLLVIIALAIGVAPTLTWFEFSGGSENLNAATVLEMHREGRWLAPTLNDQPRLAKPPLTAWMSAAPISDAVLTGINSSDPATRESAYRRFAFELRWPALALSCGVVACVYWMGRLLVSSRVGWTAAAVCASTALLLRFGRSATTDVQLAFWVALANALFAWSVLRGASVGKLLLIGGTLGLAILAKGPVALAQTVLPWLLFIALDADLRGGVRAGVAKALARSMLVTGVALAVALPWFIYMVMQHARALSIWWTEVTREGATQLERDPPFAYVTILAVALPWTAFFIGGLALAFKERSQRPARFTLCLLVVPLIVMSLVKDKNDRYLVPLLPPIALAVALALEPQFLMAAARSAVDHLLARLHWITLALLLLGVPILGGVGVLERTDGAPWYTPGEAVLYGIVLLVLLAGGWWTSRRVDGGMVAVTLVAMLALNVVAIEGYRHAGGVSECKPVADVIHRLAPPTASIWFYDPPEHTKFPPADLNLYLNRPVKAARSEAALQAAEADAVLVMLQRRNTPPPEARGWVPIGKGEYAGRFWWALVRESSSTTQPAVPSGD